MSVKIKRIKGYEDVYTISNYGEVFLVKNGTKRKTSLTKAGYVLITLSKNAVKKTFLLHRLVAEHFVPNPDGKNEVNHIDGNKLNNKASNLEWVTRDENREKAISTGLINSFSSRNNAFTDEQIHFIRELYTLGYSQSKLSRMFSVANSVIRNIVKNKTYVDKKEYEKFSSNSHLSPQVRAIVKNLFIHGYSYQEIAELCGLDKSILRDYYRDHYLPEVEGLPHRRKRAPEKLKL